MRYAIALARRRRVDRVKLVSMRGQVLERIRLYERERVARLWVQIDADDFGKAGAVVANRTPARAAEEIQQSQFATTRGLIVRVIHIRAASRRSITSAQISA